MQNNINSGIYFYTIKCHRGHTPRYYRIGHKSSTVFLNRIVDPEIGLEQEKSQWGIVYSEKGIIRTVKYSISGEIKLLYKVSMPTNVHKGQIKNLINLKRRFFYGS